MHFLKVFGCVTYVKDLRPHPSKLEDHGLKVIFIGYQDGSKAYRFYDPTTERVRISRDAIFDESASWDWGEASETTGENPFTVEHDYDLRRHVEVAVPGSSSPAPPSPTTTSPAPRTATPPFTTTPATPAAGMNIEFVTLLSSDPNLDADDDEVEEHRYRTLDNFLGTDAVPKLAHHDSDKAELHALSVEKPRTFKEADGDPTGLPRWWRSCLPFARTRHSR